MLKNWKLTGACTRMWFKTTAGYTCHISFGEFGLLVLRQNQTGLLFLCGSKYQPHPKTIVEF